MFKYIDVILDEEHNFNCKTAVMAIQNENKAMAFKLHLTDEMLDKWIYMEFIKPDGTAVSSPRLQIDAANKTVIYEITNQLTDKVGKVKTEIVIKNSNNLVWKTISKQYEVVKAINASTQIEEEHADFITEVQKIIDKCDLMSIDIITTSGISEVVITKKDGTQKRAIVSGGGGTFNHNALTNLDYEHSGHTGFQKSEEGKGLSTNDYTNTEKQKVTDNTNARHTHDNKTVLDNIENEDIESWNNKAEKDEIPEVPTTISSFENDAGYLSEHQSLAGYATEQWVERKGYAEQRDIPNVDNFITNTVNNLVNYYLKTDTYTKTEVNNLIGQISTVSIQVVQTLPTTGQSNVIYFVPKTTPQTSDIYDEYIYTNNNYEKIGSTSTDLVGYATEQWVLNKNYLTEHQSLAEYTTKTYVDNIVGNINTALENIINGGA